MDQECIIDFHTAMQAMHSGPHGHVVDYVSFGTVAQEDSIEVGVVCQPRLIVDTA